MQADNLSRALLALMLACLAFLVARDVTGRAAAGDPDAAMAGRFAISAVRSEKDVGRLLRIDSATGQVWEMGVVDEGPWKAYAEGPDGTPSPGALAKGRYELQAFTQRRAGTTLVRTDSATGRVWRTPAKNDGIWVLISEPAEASAAAAAPE